jgi:GT2 family glycosyltransferase
VIPDISVVIPTCGRQALLTRCLDALKDQSLVWQRYEVIVADDERSAVTRDLVANYAEEGVPFRYVENHGKGPAAARNVGAAAARGQILAFTHDDCVPDRRWLERGIEALSSEVGAVWGRTVMPIPSEPSGYELKESRFQDAAFVAANCFVSRALFRGIGGFDEEFGTSWHEESDLYFRLLVHGAVVEEAPFAVVVHPVRKAPWGASIRQQRKVMYDALLFKKHPELYRSRIRNTPPWRYYTMVGSATLALLVAPLSPGASMVCAVVWGWYTFELCRQRLQGTTRTLDHILEMGVTSCVIPFLSVFWRLYGAYRFRVRFL